MKEQLRDKESPTGSQSTGQAISQCKEVTYLPEAAETNPDECPSKDGYYRLNVGGQPAPHSSLKAIGPSRTEV